MIDFPTMGPADPSTLDGRLNFFDLDHLSAQERLEMDMPDPAPDTYNVRSPWTPFSHVWGSYYLGGEDYLFGSQQQGLLLDASIAHILDCRSAEESGYDRSVRTYIDPRDRFFVTLNPTSDDGQFKKSEFFTNAIHWAYLCEVLDCGNRYVQCAAGMNRGPSALYAILRVVEHMSPEEAMTTIRIARPFAGVLYWRDAEKAIKEMGL